MTFQFQTVSVELAPSGSRDKRVNEIGVTRDRAVAQNQSKVNSLVNGHPRELKKCLLAALSAYENYSYKRTPKKNRVDVRLRESELAGANCFILLGSQK